MIVETEKFSIRLNFSFAATVTLMLFFFDEKVVLNSLCASFLHECGHIFFLALFRAFPISVTLSAFGMRIERPPHSALCFLKEIFISLGGIIFNLSAALLGFVCNLFYPPDFFSFAVAVNLIVALMNSLPNINLDSGRALYYFFAYVKNEDYAGSLLNILSSFFAVLIVVFFVFYTVFSSFNISLAVVTIYILILTFKREVDK